MLLTLAVWPPRPDKANLVARYRSAPPSPGPHSRVAANQRRRGKLPSSSSATAALPAQTRESEWAFHSRRAAGQKSMSRAGTITAISLMMPW